MTIWCDLPCSYQLYHNEVHVCRMESSLFFTCVAELERLLSADEQKRAQRFIFDQHRKSYIVNRGILRVLLGCYTNTPPDKIDFKYSRNGKPLLARNTKPATIFFNLSHTKDMALYAFASCRWLGVDVEYIQTAIEINEIAKRYFHSNEVRMLSQLATEARKKCFYELWTCKEAYLKATGEGLAGLELVEIFKTNDDNISLKRHGPIDKEHCDWHLYQLEPKPGYKGALVIKGSNWNLKFYNIRYEVLMRLLGT